MEDWNWETIFYGHYRSTFNQCDIIGLKIYRIRWKKRYKGISVRNCQFHSNGGRWPKISGRRGRPHQPFFFSENYAKWSFVWYKNLDGSFFHFVIMHAFDRQTDGRTYSVHTAFSSLDRICIACSAVKTNQLQSKINFCLFGQLTRIRNGSVLSHISR